MTKKTKAKITKDMLIGEIIGNWPETEEILTEDYGFHCVGCFMSHGESLEDGARVHGLTDEEITVLVESLNEIIK